MLRKKNNNSNTNKAPMLLGTKSTLFWLYVWMILIPLLVNVCLFISVEAFAANKIFTDKKATDIRPAAQEDANGRPKTRNPKDPPSFSDNGTIGTAKKDLKPRGSSGTGTKSVQDMQADQGNIHSQRDALQKTSVLKRTYEKAAQV